ncbi:UNVERIFIED_CONTAM: SKP1-like protein 1 [Sesamum radiatum]|uniref:SKP1-like protein 1 n=1 Tax=Sesamum radiatum TaxID=300843 RepID=A0AAW2JGP9_SESRA
MATPNEIPVAETIDNGNPEASEKKTRILTLGTSDDQEFEVPESAAVLSVTIKHILEDGCELRKIPLPVVDGRTLTRIIGYLTKHSDGGVSEEEKRNFDEEFVARAEMSVLFDVVLAANYLDIKDLMDLVCQEIADRMQNKSVKWVRKTFCIENDFTPEEEKKIKEEHPWAWKDVESDEEEKKIKEEYPWAWKDVESDDDD